MLFFDAVRRSRLRGSAAHAAPVAVLSAEMIVAVWLWGPCLDAVASAVPPANPEAAAATLENRGAKLVLSANGRCVSFIDRASGRNHLAAPGPIARITVRGKDFPCSAASLNNGRLTLTFGESNVRAEIVLGIEPRYFTFEVTSVSDDAVEELEFCRFELKPEVSPAFSACVLALNLKTNVKELPQANAMLHAFCYPRFGFRGAKAALIACPADELRAVMQDVVSAAPDVPHSPLGGPWALDAPGNRDSYLFNFDGVTERTAEDWIAAAKAVGFQQIEFHGGGSFRFGDCRPNPQTYPKGRASLKAAIDKLHAAGITAGLHPYAFFIDKSCPWVTPVPDKRLAKDASFTLAADLPAGATRVPTVESTEKMSAVTGFFVRNSATVQIDDELITYTGAQQGPSGGFTGCRRGALGTRAAPHAKNAKVQHLKECFGLFVPDPDTTLFGEVAAAIAGTFNECGFDSIYLDALDGGDILGGQACAWHYESKFVFELWKRLHRPALMEMSTFHHHLWYVRSRMGAWDHPSRSHKRFIDIHCAANEDNRKMFLPGLLGWWAVQTWHGAQTEPTFPDDIEYLCCKAIGTDCGQALMGIDPQSLRTNPALARLADIFRQYEGLRQRRYFSEKVRAEMAGAGKEFTLVAGGDRPAVRRVVYTKHKVQGCDDRTNSWTVKNPFDAQAPFLRIEALLSCAPYDSPRAVTISAATPATFDKKSASSGVRADASKLPDHNGWQGGSVAFSATGPAVASPLGQAGFSATEHGVRTPGGHATSWAQWEKSFHPPLALGERQALGVWIWSDTGGGIVNLQLRSPEHISSGIADHYVDLDFKGWRYFELVEPEGERSDNYAWPYASNVYGLYRELVDFDHVGTFGVWLNAVPPGGRMTCRVSPVKALPLVRASLKNPRITFNGTVMEFPLEMESGAYLEFQPGRGCRLYGPGGEIRREVAPKQAAPELRPGSNRLGFACEAAPGLNARARITIGVLGAPTR